MKTMSGKSSTFYSVQLLCVSVILILLIEHSMALTDEQHYLELSGMMKSSTRNPMHDGGDHFSNLQNVVQSVDIENNSKKHDKRRLFALRLSDSCGSDCHTELTQHFRNRYEVINKHNVLIHSSHTDIQRFDKLHPNVVVNQLLLPADMKVDSEVRKMSQQQSADTQSNYSETHTDSSNSNSEHEKEIYQIRIVIAAQDNHDDINDFLSFTYDLQTLYNNNSSDCNGQCDFKFEFQMDQPYNEVMYGFIKTTQSEYIMEYVTAFTQRDEVIWVEKYYSPVLHNRWAKGLVETNNYQQAPSNQYNLTGLGHIVGIVDTGIDIFNCYFYDENVDLTIQTSASAAGLVLNPLHRKIIQYVNFGTLVYDDASGHGTHVAGTVAGDAVHSYGDNKKYRGMVHDAKIAFFDIGGPTTLLGDSTLSIPGNIRIQVFETLYASGARVITNSWGTSSKLYDSHAVNTDQFMWDRPDALVIFSAGNSGILGAHTVTSPSTNKNGLAIGASLNDHQSWLANSNPSTNIPNTVGSECLAKFSSRGPTSDNRLKPDLTAPGYYVTSAQGYHSGVSTTEFCSVRSLSGTSMSAPITAGYAIKVRQYFIDGYYPSGNKTEGDSFVPSGALIKAILIHSAQALYYIVNTNTDGSISEVSPITSTYPSTDQGYGRIQLNKVLHFGKSSNDPISLFILGAVDRNSTHYAELNDTVSELFYEFRTSSDVIQSAIRVTLCYTDYPSAVSASNAMVNSVDVYVGINTDATAYFPYQATGTIVSNTQVIDIPAAQVRPDTTYFVAVSAHDLVHPQPFALVITGAITYLTYINEPSAHAPSESDTYISSGSQIYIIVETVIAAILLCFIVYFSRLTRKRRDLLIKNDTSQGSWTGEAQAGAAGMILRQRQRAAEYKVEVESKTPR